MIPAPRAATGPTSKMASAARAPSASVCSSAARPSRVPSRCIPAVYSSGGKMEPPNGMTSNPAAAADPGVSPNRKKVTRCPRRRIASASATIGLRCPGSSPVPAVSPLQRGARSPASIQQISLRTVPLRHSGMGSPPRRKVDHVGLSSVQRRGTPPCCRLSFRRLSCRRQPANLRCSVGVNRIGLVPGPQRPATVHLPLPASRASALSEMLHTRLVKHRHWNRTINSYRLPQRFDALDFVHRTRREIRLPAVRTRPHGDVLDDEQLFTAPETARDVPKFNSLPST